MGDTAVEGRDTSLSPYVPAIQAEWLASGDRGRWRATDGSLVFSDVSGFTPLTERLARLGKVGAEELTDVLNDVFSQLLGVATRYGGDLLKFGGDALLLLFTGEDHALRAAAAAAGMQGALRPYRRLKTNGGTVSLRMSVGINSGPVHLFHVGGSHRELIVAGPTSSTTAALESAADAGEVLLGDVTAAAVPKRHLGAAKPPGTLLRGTPPASEQPLPPPGPVADLGVPLQLREHLRDRRDEGEHRVAVLTFIQFKGTDDLLAADGPDAVADELDGLVRATQDACETYGVTFLASDVDQNGGKLLLSAGAPVAAADDADRMLHTLRSVVLTPRRLLVRAGVNRGRAFAVDIGSRTRRTYAVMGDPTNLAARVMGKAEPQSVLATEAVTEALRDRFDLRTVEPFLVKGKTDPVRASVVGEAVGRAAAARDLPMVGRDDELELLRSALAEARRSGGRAVVVTGEPGAGKSRLVDEFLAGAGVLHVVRAEGAQYAATSPYFAVRAPLRRIVGVSPQAADAEVAAALRRTVDERRPELEPLLPLLGIPLGLDLDETEATRAIGPEFRRTRMHAAVVELLAAVMPPGGVLVVEDAQWVDMASTELFADIFVALSAGRWLTCVTRRPGPAGLDTDALPEAQIVELGPLPAEARVALVTAATAAQPLPPHVVADIAERSGGNPLFLHELIEAVRASGSTELPDTVEALIAARIDALLPEDRAVLRQASVLGARFTRDLLGQFASDVPALDPSLARLSGLLAEDADGRLRFQQGLVREVAYETLPFRIRRALHARAGDLIAATVGDDIDEFSDLLSLHFLRAERYDEAWRHARMAAARARHSAAPVEAGEFYRRAVEAARHLRDLPAGELAEVQQARGDVAELAGDYDTAAEAFRDARRLTPAGTVEMITLYRSSGRLQERRSQYDQALRWYGRGLREVSNVSEIAARARLLSAIQTSYAAIRLRQSKRLTQAVQLLLEAVENATAAGDRSALAHAFNLLAWAYSDLGDPRAAEYRDLPLPIYEELGDWAGQANVLNNLGVEAYYEGRWDDAIELWERSREPRAKAGDLVQFFTPLNNRGEILSDRGHLDEAESLFDEALRNWRAVRFPIGIGLALSNLGRLASRRRQFDSAMKRLEEAADRLRAAGDNGSAIDAYARQVECWVLQGAHDNARNGLLEIERFIAGTSELTATRVQEAMLQRLAGYAAAQAGDVEGARAALESSLQAGRAASAEFEVALTADALARVGADAGWPDVEVMASEAAAGFQALGVVWTPTVPLPIGRDARSHEG